ncbi:DUF2247 family protein [Bacillus paramycoides]|uniref:DUF2247 family protein n=1 Tax=Bacillus paramycoides TaxID=2026194 RepID=UPI0021BD2BA7|nr:DUF2247 family protein [Bacillus paramycoides]
MQERSENIMYSYKIFETYRLKYSWTTLLTGLKLGLIPIEEIATYAENYLIDNPHVSDDALLELTWGKYDKEKAIELIETIVIDLAIYWNSEIEERKWKYSIIMSMKEKNNDYDTLLENVANLYSDFNYPEDMKGFIYYLEPDEGYDPSKYTKSENIRRLINKLDSFLQSEQKALQEV